MNTPQDKTQFCADLVATAVVSRYAKGKKITPTEALRMFMATKTYDLLQDPDSRLCFESAESILDLLYAEERGDWNEWEKV